MADCPRGAGREERMKEISLPEILTAIGIVVIPFLYWLVLG